MDNYELLNSDPTVQNCHPKFIRYANREHTLLAEVIDGVVYLTDAGRAYLGDKAPAPKKTRASKKPAQDVELPNVSADDLGDLDLDD